MLKFIFLIPLYQFSTNHKRYRFRTKYYFIFGTSLLVSIHIDIKCNILAKFYTFELSNVTRLFNSFNDNPTLLYYRLLILKAKIHLSYSMLKLRLNRSLNE